MLLELMAVHRERYYTELTAKVSCLVRYTFVLLPTPFLVLSLGGGRRWFTEPTPILPPDFSKKQPFVGLGVLILGVVYN